MRFRLSLIVVSLAVLIALLYWPLPQDLTDPVSREPAQILDRSGQLLYSVRSVDFGLQRQISIEKIPAEIITALIAVEDRTFYNHYGVSLRGIARAVVANWQADRIVSGGSTLTAQLVRIRLQPERRTYLYKLKEAYLALRLERVLTKSEILESYLNTAYFGHQAYGIAAAAETYFGKSVGELSLAENALLIGLVQSPVALDPFRDLGKAKARQVQVLTALSETGQLTAAEQIAALSEPLRLAQDRVAIEAPHFIDWLLSAHSEQVQSGSAVRTTLDLDLQSEVESIVERELAKLADKNVTSAAVVILDAQTGELLTMVGSADYWDVEHDGAVNVAAASRQPGSALKPFTYALALQQGDTVATTVADIETQFFTAEGNPYIPRNYDYGYHGLVRYREALANSYNIAAVRVLERVGVDSLLGLLKAAGISTLNESSEHYGLALTLGDGEVRLIELAAAYGIFARGGQTLPLKVLVNEVPQVTVKVLDEKTAWLIADILADREARTPEFGENSPLSFDFPVAAKTGTTRNSRDNWTIGFTPNRIVGVWVGNTDNSPMRDTSGVTGAGPIFHAAMLAATKGLSHGWLPRPAGIVEQEVCKLSGQLPTDLCPHRQIELFSTGTVPTTADEIFQSVDIDTRTSQLAGLGCSERFVDQRVFAVFPAELAQWARANGWPSPPREYSSLCPRRSDEGLASDFFIIRPTNGDSFQLDSLVPDEHEAILLEAHAAGATSLEWLVDGVVIGAGRPPDFQLRWQPTAGRHDIIARSGDSEQQLWIEVIE